MGKGMWFWGEAGGGRPVRSGSSWLGPLGHGVRLPWRGEAGPRTSP